MDKSEALRLAGDLAFKRPGRYSEVKKAQRDRYFKELSESWDLWYDLFFVENAPGSEWDALTRAESGRLIRWVSPGARYLDLGCGDGGHLRLLSPHCGEAHGADISSRALTRARRACRGLKNVRLHRIAGWGLAFEDGYFDLVFCQGMLSHLDVEPALAYLREIHRVLKADGRLVFDLSSLLYEEHLEYLFAPERVKWPAVNRARFWTPEMVRVLLPRCGFSVEEMKDGGRFIEVRARKGARP